MMATNSTGQDSDATYASSNGATIGYESQLWAMADALRGNMDASEYKHVVLGLIFLKYVSDAFEEAYEELASGKVEYADPEDRDEYISRNIFWVPPRFALATHQIAGKAIKRRFIDR